MLLQLVDHASKKRITRSEKPYHVRCSKKAEDIVQPDVTALTHHGGRERRPACRTDQVPVGLQTGSCHRFLQYNLPGTTEIKRQ